MTQFQEAEIHFSPIWRHPRMKSVNDITSISFLFPSSSHYSFEYKIRLEGGYSTQEMKPNLLSDATILDRNNVGFVN